VSELKPCPFSGAKPQHGLTKVRYCQLHGDPLQSYFVGCKCCGSRFEAADKDGAFALWNRRSMTQEERDALEHGAACLVTSGWHKGESSGERAMQNAAILRRLAAVEKG
jgi:hypothetical protein